MYDTTHQNVYNVDDEIRQCQEILDNFPISKELMIKHSSSLGITEEKVNKHFETSTSIIRDRITSFEYHVRISEILKDELNKFLLYRDRPIIYNIPEDFSDELREMMNRMINKSEDIFKEYRTEMGLEEDNS